MKQLAELSQSERRAVRADQLTPLHRVGLWPRVAQERGLPFSLPTGGDALPHVTSLIRCPEVLLVLALSGIWYGVGVWYLLVHLEWFDPDTLSRMANAFYVLYSREPHLAAIGFVWPPALGAAMMPFLLLYPLWPTITSHGLAAGAVSAIAGTLFATVSFTVMRAGGLPRWVCWGFISALWIDPMWWYSSSNGLSEMPFLLMLLFSGWLLWRWISAPQRSYLPILVNGMICAAAVMIRYEMLAWAGAVAAVTLVASFAGRSSGPSLNRWTRAHRAHALTLAFVLPWGFILLLWIFFNWQIVGNPLYFLTSAYACRTSTNCTAAGTAQDAAVAATGVGALGAAVGFVLVRVALLNPCLYVCVLLACIASLRSGRWQGLALATPALAIMAMHMGMLYRASLTSLLRYHLLGIPATILVMVWLYRSANQREVGSRVRNTLGVVVVCGGWIMAATSAYAMSDPNLGSGTRDAFLHVTQFTPAYTFDTERQLSAYVDSLNLPDGSVLIDAANGYGVIVSSRRPRQFVIESDSDFQEVLANPQEHVRYVALGDVSDNFDIINATYPQLFDTGEPFATRTAEFVGTPRMGVSAPTVWRLFRVNAGTEAGEVDQLAPEPSEPAEPPASLALLTAEPLAQLEMSAPLATAPTVGGSEIGAPVTAGRPRASVPRVLLDDRFTDGDNARGNWLDAPGVAWPDAGGYRLSSGGSNRFVAVDAPISNLPSDLVITAHFRKLGGPTGGGYGLIINDQQPALRDGLNQLGDFYVLEVNDKGDMGIWRREHDRWLDLLPWTPSPAVRPGTAVNQVQVQSTGNSVIFRLMAWR